MRARGGEAGKAYAREGDAPLEPGLVNLEVEICLGELWSYLDHEGEVVCSMHWFKVCRVKQRRTNDNHLLVIAHTFSRVWVAIGRGRA